MIRNLLLGVPHLVAVGVRFADRWADHATAAVYRLLDLAETVVVLRLGVAVFGLHDLTRGVRLEQLHDVRVELHGFAVEGDFAEGNVVAELDEPDREVDVRGRDAGLLCRGHVEVQDPNGRVVRTELVRRRDVGLEHLERSEARLLVRDHRFGGRLIAPSQEHDAGDEIQQQFLDGHLTLPFMRDVIVA